jgi:hypothetical protein
MPIQLKIPKRYLIASDSGIINRIKTYLLRAISDPELEIPNVTFEIGESLIIHSAAGIDKSVAVRCEPDGRLRVFLSPPSVDKNFIDVIGKEE